MRSLITGLFILMVSAIAIHPAAVADESRQIPALTFTEIAPGIHAGLQPHDDRFNDCNVLVVVGAREVLVVDAPARAASMKALVAGIRNLTNLPLRYVVNTHWHGDHTQGNAVLRASFGPQVTVLGHASLTQDIPGRAAVALQERIQRLRQNLPQAEAALREGKGLQGQDLNEEQQAQQRQAMAGAQAWLDENEEATFLPPTLTYTRGLTVHLHPLTVELRHRPGHTRGDTVVWIPQAGVLATGDLVDDLPYIGHGFPQAWVDSLTAVARRSFTSLVPGHGPVFTGPEQLEKVKGFLEALLARAEQVRQAGGDLATLQSDPQMDSWRQHFGGEQDAAAGRFFDQTLDEALERAWRDVHNDLDMSKD